MVANCPVRNLSYVESPTLVILKICDAVIGLRVAHDHEIQGLDLSMHGEEGYILES